MRINLIINIVVSKCCRYDAGKGCKEVTCCLDAKHGHRCMERIEVLDITDNEENNLRVWLNSQLRQLWDANETSVSALIRKYFESEHHAKLYTFEPEESFRKQEFLVFSEHDTIISAWKKTSARPFIEWARGNGLDKFPYVMNGRVFTDNTADVIHHRLPSDFITLRLLRNYPASLKAILQWNDVQSLDAFSALEEIQLYLRNEPVLRDWDWVEGVQNQNGENLYCISPFRELILVNDGAYFCCSAWHGYPSVGDPRDAALDTLWNNEDAAEFRKSILDGSYRYCRHDVCPKLVNPESQLKTFTELPSVVQHGILQESGYLESGFEFINYGFDPSCNLSCPSCRHDVILAEGKAAEDIKFIERQIEANSTDLQELYISGAGDAFGSPFSRDFLARMKEENFPSLHSILLHCNGQLFNSFIWHKLPDFVRDRINYVEISIDASCQETYEINRRGGSYSKLLENLSFIRELKERGELGYIKFSFVVQQNNYDEMPAFVEFAKRYHADCAFFSRLMNWGTFSTDEYLSRDVANRSHDHFPDLLRVISDTIFNDEIVDLTNLNHLLKA
ncbi:radical SAM protein [Photobacterium sp. 53610]|uniref:radical SAM protein n=1 Tax=Photobacterium sp. 53610 TaxID=3102789 RepID=UPI002ED794C8